MLLIKNTTNKEKGNFFIYILHIDPWSSSAMHFQESQDVAEHLASVRLRDEGVARAGIQNGFHLMAGSLKPGGKAPDAPSEIAERVLIA